MEKIYNVNINQNKAEVAILLSDIVYSKAKKIYRNKEGHYINEK